MGLQVEERVIKTAISKGIGSYLDLSLGYKLKIDQDFIIVSLALNTVVYHIKGFAAISEGTGSYLDLSLGLQAEDRVIKTLLYHWLPIQYYTIPTPRPRLAAISKGIGSYLSRLSRYYRIIGSQYSTIPYQSLAPGLAAISKGMHRELSVRVISQR